MDKNDNRTCAHCRESRTGHIKSLNYCPSYNPNVMELTKYPSDLEPKHFDCTSLELNEVNHIFM